MTETSRSRASAWSSSRSRKIKVLFVMMLTRMAATYEHLENPTRDLEPLLEGLVAIGVDAERNRLADIAWLCEFGFEHCNGVGFVEQLGFEIQPRRES